jgi:arabinoxylan arabinofuranohydrolase
MVLADIHHGDWTAVSGVDFGAGASAFAASVSCMNDGGVIELRLDSPEGPRIGTLQVPSTGGQWSEVTTPVSGAEGVHDLFLIFKGKPDTELFRLGDWQFR